MALLLASAFYKVTRWFQRLAPAQNHSLQGISTDFAFCSIAFLSLLSLSCLIITVVLSLGSSSWFFGPKIASDGAFVSQAYLCQSWLWFRFVPCRRAMGHPHATSNPSTTGLLPIPKQGRGSWTPRIKGKGSRSQTTACQEPLDNSLTRKIRFSVKKEGSILLQPSF